VTADQIAKILDDLGRRIGPTGERVFGLAVRQVYVDGISSIVAFAVLAIGGLVIGPRIYRWAMSGDDYSERQPLSFMGGLLYAIVLAWATLSAWVGGFAMLNPEYSALKNILGAIGK
jgi:hypothetical protein